MQAGSELFAAHGFDGATVETIAERAGVNKAMINYHFGGKRGLYQAILTATFDEVGAGRRARSAATGRRRPPQIAAFIDCRAELAHDAAGPPSPRSSCARCSPADRIDREVFPRVGGRRRARDGDRRAAACRGQPPPGRPLLTPTSRSWLR